MPDSWSTTARRGSPPPATRRLGPSVDASVTNTGNLNGSRMTEDDNKTKANWTDVYKTGAQFSYGL
jgi:hypothetical protein